MAVLNAQSLNLALAGINNPYLTVEHRHYIWVPIPAESLAEKCPGDASFVTAWPVSANGRAVTVEKAGAYLYDFYYRIHVSPQRLDLGNVISAQTQPVYLWNAFLEQRQLIALNGIDEGLYVSGQPDPPLIFPALKELIWQLTVTPDGQPVLDTLLLWEFDNAIQAQIRITANRIIAFTFAPDWTDNIIETLSAATDILRSESAASQRRQLRLAPRRELTARVYAEGRERQLFDLAMFGWSDRVWSLPIWPDIQQLQSAITIGADFIPCSTEHLDFRDGGMAMLRGEDAFTSETVEIETVAVAGLHLKRGTQQAWPKGTRLYPARSAVMQGEPSLLKHTDQLVEVETSFLVVEPCDWLSWMPSTLYRGRPVWDRVPDDSENITHTATRLRSILDNGFSQPLISDTSRRALQVMSQRHSDLGRAARAQIRSFIYAMAGRQKTVWVPTHMDDLTLLETVSSNTATLDVVNVGYTRFSSGKAGRRDIRILLRDGTALMRRITNSTELSASVERLAIDSVLGVEVSPADVQRISWMTLMRFESDSQRIEHITDSEGVAVWATVFAEERDDEF